MFHTSAVLLHEASLILKCARALGKRGPGNKALSFTVQGTSCDVELGWGGGGVGVVPLLVLGCIKEHKVSARFLQPFSAFLCKGFFCALFMFPVLALSIIAPPPQKKKYPETQEIVAEHFPLSKVLQPGPEALLTVFFSKEVPN